ncbi:MAG: hypothetical protein Q4G08_09220 [Capnocytophaga sp.]|nr:hypothetical protein [Capnocytophaga sp.]
MKKIVFFAVMAIGFAVVAFATYSCSEKENVQEQGNRIITDEQILKIGEEHNRILKEILETTDINSRDFKAALVKTQKRILKESSGTSNLKIEKPKTLDENILIVKENLQDRDNFYFFEKTLEFLKHSNNKKSVDEIRIFLTSMKNKMKRETSSIRDYEAFLVFSSVLENSAKFWLPKNLQGEGHFYAYKRQYNGIINLNKSLSSNSETDWKDCMSDVLEADGMSAAGGFLVVAGVTAASGGTLGIPAIAAVAIESGGASAWAYYRSSNC